MFKQIVVVSSLIAGIGAAGLAMRLQANPLALSKSRVNLDTYLYSATTDAPSKAKAEPAPTGTEAQKPDVVVLPEVVVTRLRASETRAPLRTENARADGVTQSDLSSRPLPVDGLQSAPATAPRELQPCSGFRELGPMHVDDGVPSGVRGVRDLC